MYAIRSYYGIITLKNSSREIEFQVIKKGKFYTANIVIDNVEDFFSGFTKAMAPEKIILKVNIATVETHVH